MKTRNHVLREFAIIAVSITAIIATITTSCKKDNVIKINVQEENESSHLKSLGDTILPKFVNGDSLAYIYIVTNYEYPESAKNQNIEGEIIVRFTVNADSTLSNFTVLKSLFKDCDDEAVSVIQGLGKMIPASINDTPISFNICIPITLELD